MFCTFILKSKISNIIRRQFHRAAYDKSKDDAYLLILDFEATCIENGDSNKDFVQEIIEFPCIKVNLKTLNEESRFHYYVRPVIQPQIPYFCTQLTGILQEMVDTQEDFKTTLEMFEHWRRKENLTETNSLYVTFGDCDLGLMLPNQCALSNIEFPSHMTYWMDIRMICLNVTRKYPRSFQRLMSVLKLGFKGKQHSGIDDCINMLLAIRKLSNLGARYHPTCMYRAGEQPQVVRYTGIREKRPVSPAQEIISSVQSELAKR